MFPRRATTAVALAVAFALTAGTAAADDRDLDEVRDDIEAAEADQAAADSRTFVFPRRATTAVALAVAFALTAGTAAADDRDLDEVRDDIEAAEADRAAADAAVDEAREALDRINLRMSDATAELATIREQAADAEAAADAAETERDHTEAAADRAEQRAVRARDRYLDQRGQAQDRAVAFYKHGRTSGAAMMVRSVAGAGDWHEVAVSVKGATRVMTDDREMTEAAAAAAATARDTQQTAIDARAAAAVAARTAANERAQADRLHAGQQRVVDEIEADTEQHQRILDELEADQDAVAALLDQLEAEADEIESLHAVWAADEAAQVAAAARAAATPLPTYDPATAPDWAARLPAAGRPWAAPIEASAARVNIDPRLLAAVVWAESGFRPDVVSHAGAIGLAQLMPGTARGLGVNPWDPQQNLDGAARYLRQMIDQFGTLELALAAYNAGPGRVRSAGNAVPNIVETRMYVVKVAGYYNQLAG